MKVVKSLDIVNDYIEKLEQENKQLKEELERSMKANIVLDNTNTDYASIIFELEEWLKERIEWNKSILKEDAGKYDLLGFNFHREAYIKVWEDTLDKIQKLKEKYK